MRAVFLGRAECGHSDRAEQFLRSRFDDVLVVNASGPGTTLCPSLLGANPDALFAFRSHIIVRPAFLSAIDFCINFHPGPPERRGSGCVNVALAAGDRTYGVTCHHMDNAIDNGPIIDVRRFPIGDQDGVADVLARTYDNMLCQFYDVAHLVASKTRLPSSGEQWRGPVGTARAMNAMRQISLAPDAAADLQRQFRATVCGPYGPFLMLHGTRFVPEKE